MEAVKFFSKPNILIKKVSQSLDTNTLQPDLFVVAVLKI
jgi:hypothetical protein